MSVFYVFVSAVVHPPRELPSGEVTPHVQSVAAFTADDLRIEGMRALRINHAVAAILELIAPHGRISRLNISEPTPIAT